MGEKMPCAGVTSPNPMMKDMSYAAVMARRGEIMKKALGVEYGEFERGGVSFDYEAMMTKAAYPFDEVRKVQQEVGVGDTPLLELRNVTEIGRAHV